MNLCATPYDIDFVGNNPSFVIKASPFKVPGRAYKRKFSVNRLAGPGLILTTPYFTLRWSFVTTENDDPLTMKAVATPELAFQQLQKKLKYNSTVNQHYTVDLSYDSSKCYITFTDLQCISYQNPLTLVGQGLQFMTVTVESTNTGITSIPKTDYSILARIEVRDCVSNIMLSPELVFTPSDEKVIIKASIAKPYFYTRDLPEFNEAFGVKLCTNVVRFVKLIFAERADGGVGFVKQSKDVMLLNGQLNDYSFRNNIPDWVSLNEEKFYQKSKIDIFGQNNNAVVKTYYDSEQYLYLSNFSNSDVTGQNVKIKTNKNGTEDIITKTISLPSKSIVRIPVSLSALNIADAETVTTYTVAIPVQISSMKQIAIKRTFIVTPKPFYSHTLLLLNKTNLYETFNIESLSKEKSISAEKVMVSEKEMYDLTDNETIYSVNTGLKTEEEMALLEYAVIEKDNMLLQGKFGLKFSVIPGSFKIIDESEDLLSAELQFIITDKINREVVIWNQTTDNPLAETIIK